ncbi:MAG: hypothetical protein R3C53_24165 [Pirellulaceae bacterium]
MELDPTRWLVALAGFVYDWIITREWKRILLAMIPLLLLITVASLVWSGSRMDRRQLASWYMKIGEAELADWEASWAPAANNTGSDAEPTAADPSDAPAQSAEQAATQPDEEATDAGKPKEISRFAEVLFRRVQLLEPSDRSQFVIGATLAQRGAYEQAVKSLSKIAPDDGAGYPQAHAFLAMIYDEQFSKSRRPELPALIKHHATKAAQWDRAPERVLAVASDLHLLSARDKGLNTSAADEELNTSLRLFEQVVKRNPDRYVELASRALAAKNKLVYDQTREKADLHYKRKLAANPDDDVSRVNLAQLYLADPDGLDRAEELLRQNGESNRSPLVARALSEVYRLRFGQSAEQVDGMYTANMELLDMAMRLDPTNPRPFEEVARIIRNAHLSGSTSDELLIERLHMFLAEGNATTATHALLSQIYLLQAEKAEDEVKKALYAKSVKHLEQVVTRLPNAAEFLNNIAYILADLYPERLEESLEYAQRAVMASQREPNADYFDTLGTVYAKLGKLPESIAAYETAIQLNKGNIAFHQRVAEQYRLQGNDEMVASHERVIKLMLERQQQADVASPE